MNASELGDWLDINNAPITVETVKPLVKGAGKSRRENLKLHYDRFDI
jgi:hypothetical protein